MKIKAFFTFIFILIFSFAFSQNKKEQIAKLKYRLDSLYQVNNSNINKNNVLIMSVDSLKLIENSQNNAISDFKIKINELNNTIINLKSELNKSKNETSVKQKEIEQLLVKIDNLKDTIKQLQELTANFSFPYRYGQPIYIPNEGKFMSTVYLDFKDEKQIITDSLIVKFNEKDIFHFYYFTPITEDLNIQCPMEFGYIVFDNSSKEIFRNFNPNEIGGNAFSGYIEFDLASKKRRLMGLLNTGCGSGGSIQYYDLEILNGKLLQSQSMNASTGGYETSLFLPERNLYVVLTRINPESHWEGNTRYTLDIYSLINDQKLVTRSTKYIYPHFGDVGDDELLKSIEKREPTIFKY